MSTLEATVEALRTQYMGDAEDNIRFGIGMCISGIDIMLTGEELTEDQREVLTFAAGIFRDSSARFSLT